MRDVGRNELIKGDTFIVEIKKKLKHRNKTESELYAICNDVLMYSERVRVSFPTETNS